MKLTEFLRQKFTNMAVWVEDETGHALTPYISQLTDINLVAVASFIDSEGVSNRDWEAIQKEMPAELKRAVAAVQSKPGMHDKFWRYCDMFVDVISKEE